MYESCVTRRCSCFDIQVDPADVSSDRDQQHAAFQCPVSEFVGKSPERTVNSPIQNSVSKRSRARRSPKEQIPDSVREGLCLIIPGKRHGPQGPTQTERNQFPVGLTGHDVRGYTLTVC